MEREEEKEEEAESLRPLAERAEEREKEGERQKESARDRGLSRTHPPAAAKPRALRARAQASPLPPTAQPGALSTSSHHRGGRSTTHVSVARPACMRILAKTKAHWR